MTDHKQAFLILAHGAPAQLDRLLATLDDPRFAVFLHLDAKADIGPFREVATGRDVTFTPRRFDVWRKCWSMIEATEELIATALDAPEPFGYYTLLSGADYPIKSADRIAEVLGSSDREYLHYFHLDARPDWDHRVRRPWYRDDTYHASKPDPGLRDRAERAANRARRLGHRVALVGRERRPAPPQIRTLAGGSQWWSLTHGCLAYLRERMRRTDERAYFRHVDGPDELYVQSLLVNSAFRTRIAGYPAYEAWSRAERDAAFDLDAMLPEPELNLRYVDWSIEREEVPPEGGEPRGPTTLDDRDFDVLASSGALFARKMHPTRSAALLDRIDAELRSVT